MDFMLNRQTERNKESLEWKYKVLKSIYELPNKSDYLLNETLELLLEQYNNGPYQGTSTNINTTREDELVTI